MAPLSGHFGEKVLPPPPGIGHAGIQLLIV